MNRTCDINWDLRFGIPFPDGSVSKIYSSHLFEHLTFKEINILIKECRRAIKKDGVFSIAVPNARLYIEAYSNKDTSFWGKQPSYWAPAYNNTNSEIDLIFSNGLIVPPARLCVFSISITFVRAI